MEPTNVEFQGRNHSRQMQRRSNHQSESRDFVKEGIEKSMVEFCEYPRKSKSRSAFRDKHWVMARGRMQERGNGEEAGARCFGVQRKGLQVSRDLHQSLRMPTLVVK